MDEKKLMLAQEELKAKLQEIAVSGATGNSVELARLANMPYDAEFPVPEVISAISKTATVAKGEDYEYFVVGVETKTVYTVVDGTITQVNVTPDSENDLSFSTYESPEYYVYVEKLLEAKYEPIAIKTKVAMEALNRKEIHDVLALGIASAVAQSNTFVNDSGSSAIDFEKVVEMVRSVAKYGKNLVLVTGADVHTDVILMDYSEDKNREVSLAKAGISREIPIESLTYEHSGTIPVFPADKALLVAVSDSEDNEPIHFVRRSVQSIDGSGEKERVVMASGPGFWAGAVRKWAYAIVAMEQYGCVVVNPFCFAVYKNASIYS